VSRYSSPRPRQPGPGPAHRLCRRRSSPRACRPPARV
jgi:hypothetical protein